MRPRNIFKLVPEEKRMTEDQLSDDMKERINKLTDDAFANHEKVNQKWKMINGKPRHVKIAKGKRPLPRPLIYQSRKSMHASITKLILHAFLISQAINATVFRPMHVAEKAVVDFGKDYPRS